MIVKGPFNEFTKVHFDKSNKQQHNILQGCKEAQQQHNYYKFIKN